MKSGLSRRELIKGLGAVSVLPPFSELISRGLFKDFSTVELGKQELYADGEDSTRIKVTARDFRGNLINENDLELDFSNSGLGQVLGRLTTSYGGLRRLDYFLVSPATNGFDNLEVRLKQKSTGITTKVSGGMILYKPSFAVEADSGFVSKVVSLNGQRISDSLVFLKDKLKLPYNAGLDIVLKENDERALYLVILNPQKQLVALIKDSGIDGLWSPTFLRASEVHDIPSYQDLVIFNDLYGQNEDSFKQLLGFLGSRREKTDYGIFLRDIVRKFWDGDFAKPEKHLGITVFDPQINLGNDVSVKNYLKFKNYGNRAFEPRELTVYTEFPELNASVSTNLEEPVAPRETREVVQDFRFSDGVYHNRLEVLTRIEGSDGKIYAKRGIGHLCSDCGSLMRQSLGIDGTVPEILKYYKAR